MLVSDLEHVDMAATNLAIKMQETVQYFMGYLMDFQG